MFDDTPRTFIGTTSFRVEGMISGHCEWVVTTAIGALPGVDTVTVELSTGTVTVSAGQPLDRADIVTAVKEAGYTILV